jgi:hypothetical protein
LCVPFQPKRNCYNNTGQISGQVFSRWKGFNWTFEAKNISSCSTHFKSPL